MRNRRLLRTAIQGLLALAAAGLSVAAHAQEAVSLVRIATNVERSYFPPVEVLLRKAYASLGLQVEFLPWPLPRAQLALRAGQLDAVAMRVGAYFEQTPFVRKIDVPLLELFVYAYGRPPCPAALPLETLAQQRISYQRGVVATEAMIPEASRVPANTPSDAFLNVQVGSATYALVLTTPWMVELPVDTPQGSLCRIATPLSRSTLFHGVHESRATWVQPLEQALRGLRERGEIQQAWVAYEREIAAQSARLLAQPGRSLTLTPSATPGSGPARPQQ